MATPKNTRIVAYGGPGQGLWFTVVDNLPLCRGTQIDSICGHHVEWAGSHLTPRMHLPTDLKLMSANIVNIVSLNSYHSRIIRNAERRGSQVERCRIRMA
jgi:hypothetical protein